MTEALIYGAALLFALVAVACGMKLGKELAGLRVVIRWRVEDDPNWSEEGGIRRW